jgi:hypothetical protein
MGRRFVVATASSFNDVLKNELKINAAWLPIATPFALGDYGVMSDGIFTKVGNLANDFQIPIKRESGQDLLLKFASADVDEVRFEAGGKVTAFSNSPNADAKLTLQFRSANSFFLRSNLTAIQMSDVAVVARAIFDSPKWDDWSYNYRVVSTVYNGRDSALLSSTAAGASVELSGTADALSQLDVGNAAVGLKASEKKSIGLDLVGASGVVGLKFFKLTLFGGGKPKLLATDPVLPEYFASEAELQKDDL